MTLTIPIHHAMIKQVDRVFPIHLFSYTEAKMYKPNKKKIHSLLAHFREKTRNTFTSTPGIYTIFFHTDVTHLNTYGRLVTFDSYTLRNYADRVYIIPKYLEQLVMEQKFDFEFDPSVVSTSDLNHLDAAIDLHNNYRDFNSFVRSFAGLDIPPKDKPEPITLRMMLYKGKSEEAIEDLEFMHKHASHNSVDFDIPKDIQRVY